MKLKPGKYVQRDGGIATVAAVDESRPEYHQAIGWAAGGNSCSWAINGMFAHDPEHRFDLLKEYREPREFWVVKHPDGITVALPRPPQELGYSVGTSDIGPIHVREVLP